MDRLLTPFIKLHPVLPSQGLHEIPQEPTATPSQQQGQHLTLQCVRNIFWIADCGKSTATHCHSLAATADPAAGLSRGLSFLQDSLLCRLASFASLILLDHWVIRPYQEIPYSLALSGPSPESMHLTACPHHRSKKTQRLSSLKQGAKPPPPKAHAEGTLPSMQGSLILCSFQKHNLELRLMHKLGVQHVNTASLHYLSTEPN
jgi:hypothetical protein